MKKGTFLFALVALVLANVIIFSCKKENAIIPASNQIPATEISAGDRNATCPDIYVYRGRNLVICGIDGGSACYLCSGSYSSATVMNNVVESFAFTNSSVFSIYNPTGSSIQYAVGFNCVNQNPQFFTIPAYTTQTYHVDIVNIGGGDCCVAHAGCTH